MDLLTMQVVAMSLVVLAMAFTLWQMHKNS
jgi:hypothetical protein